MENLVRDLENIFHKVTVSNYPLEWDEDHITLSLMKEMRGMLNYRTVYYEGFEKIVHWTSFKNKGRTETGYGDISLLVNIQFIDGKRLQGVAFLEAKKNADKNNFPALSLPQLERIHQNAPYSYLLLYLHQPDRWPLKFPDDATWTSNIWTSPINTAIPKLKQLNPSQNGSVLKISLPFSMLLTSRLFWGLDLDYRPEAFSLALKGLNGLAPTQYLAAINAFYNGQAPIDVDLSGNWEEI